MFLLSGIRPKVCNTSVFLSSYSWTLFVHIAVHLVFRTSAWILSLYIEAFRLSIFSLCSLDEHKKAVIPWM